MVLRTFVSSALLFVAAGSSALAQQGGEPLPPRWQALRVLPEPGTLEREALSADIRAGTVDPLALLQHLSSRVAVPSGFAYQRECSSALGSGMAVFTRGDERSADAADILAQYAEVLKTASPADQRRLGELTLRYATSVATAPEVQTAVDFYAARGFTLGKVVTTYPFTWAQDPDGRRLAVEVSAVNPAAASPYPECQALPSGTTILLSVDRRR